MDLWTADGNIGPNCQRVQELQQEVCVLKDALSSRHPNSVAAIIHASKPSAEESLKVKQLEQEVSDMLFIVAQ